MTKEWKPGINHIEFWVSDLQESLNFYTPLFQLIGWKRLSDNAFSAGEVEIYFCEKDAPRVEALGPRHICFQAVTRDVVDAVGAFLKERNADIIRGPLEQSYSKDYYTVDFRDPDGYILEVAHTPYMVL